MILSAFRVQDHPGSLLLEFDDCFVFTSKWQISGLFPKEFPYSTGAYWDDVAAIAMILPPRESLTVLGSGIFSYLPLINKLAPNVSVCHIEKSTEIIDLGLRISNNLAGRKNDLVVQSDAISWCIQNPPSGSVFVDLYDADGILETVLDKKFLGSLAQSTTLLAVNVFDETYPKSGNETQHFIAVLNKYFHQTAIARRKGSNTLFATNQKFALSSLKEVYANTPEFTEFAKIESPVGVFLQPDHERRMKFEKIKKVQISETENSLLGKIVFRLKTLDPIFVARAIRHFKKA